jgi:hypothetical protein
MPKRRDADPAIRLTYIDASKLQVYIDEPRAVGAAPSSVRAIVRMPGEAAKIVDAGPDGIIRGIMPGLDISLGERWDHAIQAERPQVVPDRERRKDEIGTHGHAMLAVEVSATPAGAPPWKRIVWLPFTRYLMADLKTERTLELPDGRHLTLAFGRIRYSLPGFMVQLMDFKMIAYDHRGSPRDYQSILRVIPMHDGAGSAPFDTFTHVASLNAPLQAPFHWSDDRSYVANVAGTLVSRLSPRQFKFSQAGWDQQGWAQTQKLADAGQLPRPYASFTILGVGNNPGIHVVALGAILMSVGIPWAFYIKPFIMKRRRDRLKAQLARESRPAAEPIQAVAPGAFTGREVGVTNQEVRA